MTDALRIAWWNTGINPPRGETKIQNFPAVYASLARLITIADVVILGETMLSSKNAQPIAGIVSNYNNTVAQGESFIIINHAKCEKAHIAVMHKAAIGLRNPEFLRYSLDEDSRENPRIALKLQLTNIDGSTFSLYAVHWPSLIYHGNIMLKEESARVIAEDVLIDNGGRALCIGDFNVEPHQSPFYRIRCSRTRSFLAKGAKFYNPFWRFLNEESGTCRHDNKYELQCPVPLIDQAIVSQKLSEHCSAIEPEILTNVYSPSEEEHFPIKVTLRF